MKTVLVVDDDPDIRSVITWKLTQAGYATLVGADGAGALVAATLGDAAGRLPDLVLLDWMMPKMTGIEVLGALRGNPTTARIPIILLTAKAQDVDIEQGLAAGAEDFIVKPFSPREMLRRVEVVLARSGST